MATTHRELYAEQYGHPLVGKLVYVSDEPFIYGTVARVVPSRFGELVILVEYCADRAWLASKARA
jgi:hypothetical protein